MQNQLGYIKENGNVIYVQNNIEKIAHIGKGKIFDNKSDFKTADAIIKGMLLVDVSLVISGINDAIEANNKEVKRVADIMAKLILPATFKLSSKEKKLLKIKIEATASAYYLGNVTVTDSSRGKGGYFKYSDSVIDGVFYNNKDKGISIWDGGEVVSSRKKNFTTNYKKIEIADLLKLLVKNIESKENAAILKYAKISNAKTMIENIDVFSNKVFEILSTSANVVYGIK